jgi:hypothetical protein
MIKETNERTTASDRVFHRIDEVEYGEVDYNNRGRGRAIHIQSGPLDKIMNGWGRLPLNIWRTQTQEKTTACNDGVSTPLIHHGRPPSRAAAATRGATNLISGLRGTFCGSATVVGCSGAE